MTKILLIEDNEMNVDMLPRRQTRHGFDVIAARDGAAGLAEATNERQRSFQWT